MAFISADYLASESNTSFLKWAWIQKKPPEFFIPPLQIISPVTVIQALFFPNEVPRLIQTESKGEMSFAWRKSQIKTCGFPSGIEPWDSMKSQSRNTRFRLKLRQLEALRGLSDIH